MSNVFLFSALAIFIYMVTWFILALLKKDNSIIDIGWGLGFVLVYLTSFYKFGAAHPGQYLLGAMIGIWGIRLAAHIYTRAIGKGEDWRYKQWRKDWGKNFVLISFFRVFMLQGVFMFIVALPIMVVNDTLVDRPSIGWFEIVGAAIWLLGFVWEAVSDYQLLQFKRDPANKGKIMRTGLWAFSRHPNYFGEIVLWWGIFIVSIPYGNWWVALISPIVITWLLTRVSGVPMLERKYKDNPEYKAYQAQTNALIPKIIR